MKTTAILLSLLALALSQCTEDPYYPNQDWTNARELPFLPNSTLTARLCTNADYFKMNTNGVSGWFTVIVTGVGANNSYFDLSIRSAYDSAIASTSFSADVNEAYRVNVSSAFDANTYGSSTGSYVYFKFSSYYIINVAYNLNIRFTTVCPDDQFAGNSQFSNAAAIDMSSGLVSFDKLSLCPTGARKDFFKLNNLPVGVALTLEVGGYNCYRCLSVSVYSGSEANVIANSSGSSNLAVTTVPNMYFSVQGTSNGYFVYSFTLLTSSCMIDRYEPNNGFQNNDNQPLTPITLNTLVTGLSICPEGDQDGFMVSLPSGPAGLLTVTYTVSNVNQSYYFPYCSDFLFVDSYSSVSAESRRINDYTVSCSAFINVPNPNNVTRVAFNFQISGGTLPAYTLLAIFDTSCRSDQYYPNRNFNEAKEIFTYQAYSASICPADTNPDFFKITVTKPATFSISVSESSRVGITWRLYGPSQNVIANVTGSNYLFSTKTAGTYYISVSAPANSYALYTVALTLYDCLVDAYEPNSEDWSAPSLPLNQVIPLSLCPSNDVDYFKVLNNEEGKLTITLNIMSANASYHYYVDFSVTDKNYNYLGQAYSAPYTITIDTNQTAYRNTNFTVRLSSYEAFAYTLHATYQPMLGVSTNMVTGVTTRVSTNVASGSAASISTTNAASGVTTHVSTNVASGVTTRVSTNVDSGSATGISTANVDSGAATLLSACAFVLASLAIVM